MFLLFRFNLFHSTTTNFEKVLVNSKKGNVLRPSSWVCSCYCQYQIQKVSRGRVNINLTKRLT